MRLYFLISVGVILFAGLVMMFPRKSSCHRFFRWDISKSIQASIFGFVDFEVGVTRMNGDRKASSIGPCRVGVLFRPWSFFYYFPCFVVL